MTSIPSQLRKTGSRENLPVEHPCASAWSYRRTAITRPEANALRSLRELAERAARAGGAVARQRFGQTTNVRLKPDRSEVSEVDEAAQRAVIDCIHAQRPDDGFVAEEKLVEPEGQRR